MDEWQNDNDLVNLTVDEDDDARNFSIWLALRECLFPFHPPAFHTPFKW